MCKTGRHFEVTLFFDDLYRFTQGFPEWDNLLEGLQDGYDTSFSKDAACLEGGTHKITVKRQATPLDLVQFDRVLDQYYHLVIDRNISHRVVSHSCAMSIRIEEKQPMSFRRKVLALQEIAGAFVERLSPQAVYWSQSEQLFTGQSFARLTRKGFDLALYVQPGYFRSGEFIDGHVTTGVDAYGAHDLIGMHVVFEEHPQLMIKSYAAVIAVVAFCHEHGVLPTDGETFRLANREPSFTVTHQPPTADAPAGTLRLSLDDQVKELTPRFSVPPLQAAFEASHHAA